MMSHIAVAHLSEHPPAIRPGIRVVVIERDWAIRKSLEEAFAQNSSFVVVASAESLHQGISAIEDYVPEIVLCGREHLEDISFNLCDALVLESTSGGGNIALQDSESNLFSLGSPFRARSLAQIELRVLSRKREWLRHLLSSGSSSECREVITVQESPLIHLPLDTVVWICAQRNYIVLHGSSETWKQRGSLSNLRSTSFSSQFLRISRSCAINRARVRSVVWKDNHVGIIMTCGTILRPSRSYLRAVLQAIPNQLKFQIDCQPEVHGDDSTN